MADHKRQDRQLPYPGPYIGIVKGTADVNRMGRLDVYIPEIQDTWDNESEIPLADRTVTVSYCSPFAGQTPNVDAKANPGFANTQKSYGFWMVPPDVETRVLVMFANGNINKGFWIGCIPEIGMNHMVPGIASADPARATGTDDDKDYYKDELGLSNIPVAEANRTSSESFKDYGPGVSYDVDRSYGQRPIHTYHADELIKQGLIEDIIRGTTSSSARRETPSQVFGISTPGPIDPSGQQAPAREAGNLHALTEDGAKLSHSRLGGHQFVMDDGTPPSHNGKNFTTDIQNELVRIRTRSGAQILLHNTEDLVYIINNSGDAWIELSKNGKIDVYANDSISVHTNNDLNLRAERDINIESGRNINLKATGQNEFKEGDSEDNNHLINSDQDSITGRIHMDAKDNIEMISAKSVEVKAGEDMEIFTVKDFAVKSEEQTIIEAQKDLRVMTREDFMLYVTDSSNIEIGSSSAGDSTGIGNLNVFIKNDIDMTVGRTVRKHITTDNILSVGADNKVFAGNDHLVNTGNEIHFNTSGKVASTVYDTAQRPAADLVGDLGERVPVDVVVPLTTFPNAITPENKAPYGERESIMKRVPTAEPYAEHENKRQGFINFTDQVVTDREQPDDRSNEAVINEAGQSTKLGAAGKAFRSIGGARYSGKGPEA